MNHTIKQLHKQLIEKLDAIDDWSSQRARDDFPDDSYEPADEYDFFDDGYEDAWNDPIRGQELRRRDARDRCSHIRFGEGGEWVDCETHFDEILQRIDGGNEFERGFFFGRYRVP